MKKLLVLMLVLGMASATNAVVISWSVDTVTVDALNASVVVQIASDTSKYSWGPEWVGSTPAATVIATITNIVARASAGPSSVVQNPSATGYAGWWKVMTADMVGTPNDQIVSGAQYDVTIQGKNLGTWSLGIGAHDTLGITVLPEPTTVALLGLGGLFLLRRRK